MSTLKIVRITAFIFMGFIAMSSCRARIPWVQVSNIPFDDVRYDSSTHTIWLTDLYERAVFRLDHPDDNLNFGKTEEITTPKDSRISQICVSNGVWISSFVPSEPPKPLFSFESPVPHLISRYTDDVKAWKTIAVTTKPAQCKSLRNSDVVFWSENKIIRFDSIDAQPRYIDINWEVMDVVDDLEGNLWVSTQRGEIYRQVQNDWVLVDNLASQIRTRLFIDNSGNLWVASDNTYIYKYSISNSTPSQEKVFESSLGRWQDFFQDNSGAIWLVASNRLLVQREGQFQEVGLPPRSELLRFGAFDSASNTLFVSTEEGVFALDLDK